jgi:hypothetical protein
LIDDVRKIDYKGSTTFLNYELEFNNNLNYLNNNENDDMIIFNYKYIFDIFFFEIM